jgi:hypothetical protein
MDGFPNNERGPSLPVEERSISQVFKFIPRTFPYNEFIRRFIEREFLVGAVLQACSQDSIGGDETFITITEDESNYRTIRLHDGTYIPIERLKDFCGKCFRHTHMAD